MSEPSSEPQYSDADEMRNSEEEPCGCGNEGCYGVDCDWDYYHDKYGPSACLSKDKSDSGSDTDEREGEGDDDDTGPTSGSLFELGQALTSTGTNERLSFSGEADFLPSRPTMYIDGVGSVGWLSARPRASASYSSNQ